MWICLNNAYLSIVAPAAKDIPAAERKRFGNGADVGLLMVRARKEAHLTAVFGKRKVYRWAGRDYPCRVFIGRSELGALIADAITKISYGNFKNSVKDDALHDAYSAVWGVMHRYQRGGFDPRPVRRGKQGSFGYGADLGPDTVREEWSRPATGYNASPEPFGSGSLWDDLRSNLPEGDAGPCGEPGCTEDNPCFDCIGKVIDSMDATGAYAEVEAHRLAEEEALAAEVGPYNEEEDFDAQSHLRHSPG